MPETITSQPDRDRSMNAPSVLSTDSQTVLRGVQKRLVIVSRICLLVSLLTDALYFYCKAGVDFPRPSYSAPLDIVFTYAQITTLALSIATVYFFFLSYFVHKTVFNLNAIIAIAGIAFGITALLPTLWLLGITLIGMGGVLIYFFVYEYHERQPSTNFFMGEARKNIQENSHLGIPQSLPPGNRQPELRHLSIIGILANIVIIPTWLFLLISLFSGGNFLGFILLAGINSPELIFDAAIMTSLAKKRKQCQMKPQNLADGKLQKLSILAIIFCCIPLITIAIVVLFFVISLIAYSVIHQT